MNDSGSDCTIVTIEDENGVQTSNQQLAASNLFRVSKAAPFVHPLCNPLKVNGFPKNIANIYVALTLCTHL